MYFICILINFLLIKHYYIGRRNRLIDIKNMGFLYFLCHKALLHNSEQAPLKLMPIILTHQFILDLYCGDKLYIIGGMQPPLGGANCLWIYTVSIKLNEGSIKLYVVSYRHHDNVRASKESSVLLNTLLPKAP